MYLSTQFTIGDLTQLLSGGPVMTVIAINNKSTNGQGTVRCSWFTVQGEYRHHDFLPETLRIFQVVDRKDRLSPEVLSALESLLEQAARQQAAQQPTAQKPPQHFQFGNADIAGKPPWDE